MKEKKQYGISVNEAGEALVRRIMTGDKLDKIVFLKEVETPNKDIKEKMLRLDADKNWIVRKNCVQYKNGMHLDCFASWGRHIVIHYKKKNYRGIPSVR